MQLHMDDLVQDCANSSAFAPIWSVNLTLISLAWLNSYPNTVLASQVQEIKHMI